MNATSYERLIEELPLGVLVAETDGSVAVVNARALELLGLPRRVAARARIDELIPGAEPAFESCAVSTTRVAIDDRRLMVESRPVQGIDGPRLVTVRDVTDAGDARRLKETFLSDLLHRMRTPLTAIKSSLSMIQCGGFAPAVAGAASLVDAGHAAADQLVRVLAAVRDLFRIDAGLLDDGSNRTEEVDLGELLGRVRDHFADAIAREIDVQTVTPAEPVVVATNEELLFVAVRRVARNAVDYSPDGGVVTLSIRSEPEQVEITVSDRGPGLGDEEEMRAFDRFYRGPDAVRAAPDGLGLGLPIARGIVRHLGGEIELETNPGLGTRVSILVPRVAGGE